MNTKSRAEPSKRATLVAAAVVLSLIGGVLYGIEALWDATTDGTSTTASQGVSEPVEDELSETERLAAQVAAEFEEGAKAEFTPPKHGFVRDEVMVELNQSTRRAIWEVLKCLSATDSEPHAKLLAFTQRMIPDYWEPPSTLPSIELNELIASYEERGERS